MLRESFLRFFSRAHQSKLHLPERDTTVPALKEIVDWDSQHPTRALCPRIAHVRNVMGNLRQLGRC